MSKSSEALGMHPQGCKIKLYHDADSDKSEEYELHSIRYELLPTGVAICTYNTPKSLNSLALNQQWETFALLEHMTRDEAVRVAVWTGEGERAFNSGADLKNDRTVKIPEHIQEKMSARNMAPVTGDFVLASMTKAFWDFPKPSIVAVNGMAIGGAANIALVNFHDLVICAEGAKFMYPFPKLGFTPELGSSYMMPYLVGFAKAKEIMFLGDWISAQEAKSLGLVNRVVKQTELLTEAINMAERLVLFHPAALHHSKRIMNSHIRKHLDAILEDEQEAISASLIATGGPPGVAKWMQKQQEWFKSVKAKM